ncbi:MAG: SH3 domain-containing protein [Muribaculaceae bacterium]|nr:SH3 domain-containing protein [Muribaculaceae bacterium]
MRSGPRTSYALVTQFTPDSTVTMIDNNNGKWAKVEYKGKLMMVLKVNTMFIYDFIKVLSLVFVLSQIRMAECVSSYFYLC